MSCGGGGIRCNNTSPNLTNITIAHNTSLKPGGGIYVESGAHPVGHNLILWGNVGPDTTSQIRLDTLSTFVATYSCIQWGYAGTGNIFTSPTFVTGSLGDYYLSQTAAGQPVNSPCVDSGDPAAPMVTGSTRTDHVQDQGVVDMGYHYPAASAPPAGLDVTMTPVNPPIVIPANGGQFQFIAGVQRTQGPQAAFYAWARDRYPDGTYTGNLLGPVQINPPVGVTVNRTRTQVVPSSWPAGVHYYIGYAHTTVSYPATDADSFSWMKSTARDGGATITTWENFGEGFAPYEVASTARDGCPTGFSLEQNRPNPFNPETAISYQLLAISHVSLKVYDIAGRLVATLVDGWREAGSHQVTFDGSHLAAGVYLLSMQAGDFSAVQKMVLVK